MPLVELQQVSVNIGSTPILSDIDLTLEPGEVLGVAGPNGAGKTTLLELVATLRPPTGGSGRVLDADLGSEAARRVRHAIGMSGHEPALYPELTLYENLAFYADLAGIDRRRVDSTLTDLGLEAVGARRADHASNGMQRRVDLGRLLMLDPRLLLLDEAHAGLDEASERIIDVLIKRVIERGGGCLMVSHHPEVLARRCHRRVTVRAGRIEP